jgi:protein-tyrosine phosphatase
MERRLDVDGCNNFRDLGGYPAADGMQLRWRRLFRADGLHHLTHAGVSTFRDTLAIDHIIDLRSSAELELDGRGPLAVTDARFHHLPLFDGGSAERDFERPPDWTLADLYFGMLQFAEGPIARVVETIARADGPAVYHCTAGKDRTGVVSAVILGALGVPDEILIADYAATKESLEAIIERLMQSDGYQGMFENLPPDTLHAEPETMIGLLERVRGEYGSMQGYLEKAGAQPQTLDRLAARLLEPA